MWLFPMAAWVLALGAMPTALPAEPPAATGGIASHAASWRRVAGGDWAFVLTVTPAPGWHVYWENPGDSGSAPRIELTLPRGWEAGAVQFPRPDVAMHDDEVFYGYDSPVQYVVPVRRVPDARDSAASPGAAAAADGGSGATPTPWSMRARVMACKERCVMAELSASGETAAVTDAAELPAGLVGAPLGGRALPDTPERAGVTAKLNGTRLVVEGPAHGQPSARFIPCDVPGMEIDLPLGQPAIEGALAGGRFRIELPLGRLGADPAGPAVAGLVLLGNRPGDPCVRLAVPHAAPAPAQPPESAAPRRAK
ncbi:MAG: protein-disulfide reductase DsbD N-terminal domain-containing protein [Phycisphaerales bacterium]